ncbi:MAG: glycosyltransferase family 4 protein [bacterium]
MKIAFINHPTHHFPPVKGGSAAIWINEMAGRLAKRHHVFVYGRKNKGQLSQETQQGVKIVRVSPRFDEFIIQGLNFLARGIKKAFGSEINPFLGWYYYRWYYYLIYILQIAFKIRQERVDLIHIHNFIQFVPIIRRLNTGVPIVFHAHGVWLTKLDPARVVMSLKQVDLILGVSDYITNSIKQAYPEFSDRCFTLYNGVNADLFSPKGREALAAAKKRASLDGHKVILYAGNLSPEKGVHVLIEAFGQVAEKLPETKLVIIGPDWGILPMETNRDGDDLEVDRLKSDYPKRLKSLAAKVKGRVEFIDILPQAELACFYNSSEVFVYPSIWKEAFGLPMAEAMACERPVIGTKVGGIPEVIKDKETGLLVTPNDVEALSSAIYFLLTEPSEAGRLGKNGREMVRKNFSWEKIADDLVALYNKVG